MADLSRTMLHRVQEAFQKKDRLLARKVIASDMQVNRLHTRTIEALILHLQEHPEHASATAHLLSASKALERIADHVKNIAGHVVFLIEGIDLRRHTRSSRAGSPQETARPRVVLTGHHYSVTESLANAGRSLRAQADRPNR